MKKVKKFNVGDKVFAKVKGYPAWPAKIVSVAGKKYNVLFYGTNETSSLKPEDIFYYLQNKDKFAKNPKRKDYKEAVDQIEADIEEAGTDGQIEGDADTTNDLDESQEEVKKNGNKRKKRFTSGESKSEKLIKLDPEIHEKEATNDNDYSQNVEETKSILNAETEAVEQDIKQDELELKEKVAQEEKSDLNVEQKENDENKENEDAQNKENEDEENKENAFEENKENEDDEDKENAGDSNVENPVKINECQTEVEVNNPSVNNIDNNNDADDDNQVVAKIREKINIHDVNVQLIPEFYFTSLKKYAEQIKLKEDAFKNQKPDPETIEDVYSNKINILAVKLPNNQYAGIKYKPQQIRNYESEFERGLEDAKQAKEILQLQEKLANGDEKIDSDLVVDILPCEEVEIENLMNLNILKYKQSKLDWLKNDTELYRCTMVIKTVLALDKAFPKEAIKHLHIMADLNFDQLTLLKHPQFIDMTERLLKYVGNVESWNYTGEELVTFESDAKLIRELAKDLYDKYKSLFSYKDDENFLELFEKESQELKNQTKELNKSQFFAMSARPNTRKYILENIYELFDSTDDITLPFNENNT